MHKIDGPGHLGNTFVNEDAATGRAPTVVTPEWLNAVQGEIIAVIESADLPLNKSNSAQLLQALQSGMVSRTNAVDATTKYQPVVVALCAALAEV
jgi:hypothetical protein